MTWADDIKLHSGLNWIINLLPRNHLDDFVKFAIDGTYCEIFGHNNRRDMWMIYGEEPTHETNHAKLKDHSTTMRMADALLEIATEEVKDGMMGPGNRESQGGNFQIGSGGYLPFDLNHSHTIHGTSTVYFPIHGWLVDFYGQLWIGKYKKTRPHGWAMGFP